MRERSNGMTSTSSLAIGEARPVVIAPWMAAGRDHFAENTL
jgi:hypothetical protein